MLLLGSCKSGVVRSLGSGVQSRVDPWLGSNAFAIQEAVRVHFVGCLRQRLTEHSGVDHRPYHSTGLVWRWFQIARIYNKIGYGSLSKSETVTRRNTQLLEPLTLKPKPK